MPKKFLFIIACAIFAVFVFFSYLVAKELFTQLDFDITVKLQDRLPRRLDYPFSVLSILGTAESTTILGLLLGLFFLVKRMWLTACSMILFPISVAIEVYGKLFLEHPGPPFLFYRGVLDVNFPSHYVHTDYSYPSGHVTRTAFLIVLLLLYLYFKVPGKVSKLFQLGLVGLLGAMLISRVYLGEHWTTDIIGGLLLGTSLAFFSAITFSHKARRLDTAPA